MVHSRAFRWGTFLLAMAVLGGCGTTSDLLEGKKIDYKSSGKLPPLDIPPDLTNPGSDDRYAIPDINSSGSATFSVYNQERSGQSQTQVQSGGVLPSVDKVTIQRSGSQRWLVVNATPDQVWPVVKEFWQENGFIIRTEQPQSGIMETDWAENRAKIPMDPIRNVLSKVVDSLYSTAERDKFRTRLERGADGGTEIYISHRGMYEVVQGNGGNTQTVWEPRPADPELEAEMLRRLMVRFGVQEARAQAAVAAGTVQQRATMTQGRDGGHLDLFDPFDRAWRRVGLALDRVGFTVEDRDRSAGLYYVRYLDPEAEAASKKDKGFLGKLAFWNSSDKKAQQEQYRVLIRQSGEGSRVEVLDKNGQPDRTETGTRILTLLYEQLK